MKQLLIVICGLMLFSCSAKVSEKAEEPTVKPLAERLPTYEKQLPSGQAFGASWVGQKAVFRKINDPSGNSLVQILIFPREIEGVCSLGALPQVSYLSLLLPEIKVGAEHASDLKSNEGSYPVVLVNPSSDPIENIIAEQSKFRINAVNAENIQVQVFAQGSDEFGRPYYINGEVFAEDCQRFASFQDWLGMQASDLRLLSIDGADMSHHGAFGMIERRTDLFRDPTNGIPVPVVSFPLVVAVGSQSLLEYNFGPLQGLGKSFKQPLANGTFQYFYEYTGPILLAGKRVQMELKMQTHFRRVGRNNQLGLRYRLHVPGVIESVEKSLEFVKVSP